MLTGSERSRSHDDKQPLILVVGAGQAGLAAGYYLKQAGIPYLVVEKSLRVGDVWRSRYSSLTLFTPRSLSTLPGLPLAGNRDNYPTRDEFADYLERYATIHRLSVRLSTTVTRLTLNAAGGFDADLDGGERLQPTGVIIATGGFQNAVRPRLPLIDPDLLQLTAATYRDPCQIAPGRTLIVGDGASGRDIAAELAASHKVSLATGKPRKLIPEFILGKNIWWWLSSMGILSAISESWLGKRMRMADPFPDRNRSLQSLQARGVEITRRLVSINGRTAVFEDGKAIDIDSVIWSIGYRDDVTWLQVPGTTSDSGQFLHNQGVSPVPGIYFVGRPWQRNRESALISGAGPDAKQIVQSILRTTGNHVGL